MTEIMTWVPVVVAIVISYVRSSGASVTITALGAMNTEGGLKCGSNVTMMCKMDQYNGTMVWKAGDSPMMSCSAGACKIIPPYHDNYDFSFERANGIFNVSIHPVTFGENGLVFECSDGILSEVLTTSVKVLLDNGTTSLTVPTNITNGTGNLEVKVTTGCVYPTENVRFEWFYFKEGENPLPYTFGDQIDGPTNDSSVDCTSGDCGGDEVKQLESALTFEQDVEGEDYFLQAHVISSDNNDTIVLSSKTPYKLKFSGGNATASVLSEQGIKMGLIITLGVTGFCCAVLAIAICVVIVFQNKADPEKQKIVEK